MVQCGSKKNYIYRVGMTKKSSEKKLLLNMRKFVLACLLAVPFIVLSQEKKTYNIGILVDLEQPELIPILEELQNEISDVVGEDAIIRYPEGSLLSNGFDLEKAANNYQTLLASEVDIILAFGIVNNELIIKQESFPKPTILFGTVNNDFVEIKQENQASGIPNFTYLIASRSYRDDLATFKELTSFKKIGILIQQPFMDVYPFDTFFDKEMEQLATTYKLITYMNYEDIAPNLQDIDALYIAEAFYLTDGEVKKLAEDCIRLGLPSFTSGSVDDIRLGILATNQGKGDITRFFRRIALTVEAYIDGQNLADLPIYMSFEPNLTLNYNTAEKIGLPIKMSLISRTDFIGDFNEKVSERKYNLLEVMNDVLANNLALQTSQKELELSEKDLQTAWTNYIPNITADAGATYIDPDLAEISQGLNPEYSTDGTITLSQTLFSAEANTSINTQKDLLASQQELYNADQLDAIFEASNAYFNALIFKSNLQITATNLDLTKKNLEIAEENFEAGLKGKTDVLRFRSELANDMQSMIESANALEQAFYELNRVLNNPIEYNIDVDEAELEKGLFERYNSIQLRELLDDPTLRRPFINFLVEEAKNNAPEIKSLDYNISATGRRIKLNSAGRLLPTLALQGQYNHNFNQWGVGVNPNFVVDNYRVGLNLAIPLVDQNRKNVNRQIAMIQKEQLDLSKSDTNLAIETNINNAVVSLVNQVSNIELSRISEISAKEALELTQTSYSEGAVTIVQLLDAQNNYLNTSLARATAVYNYLLSSFQLERFIGYYFLLHSRAQNDEFINRFTQYLENNN